jgi:3-isopropylmalate dehydratase small subunit
MCLGIASRKAGPGEVWLSSQNRNYKNRMGEGSLAYLASAATVAASSMGMQIRDPRPLLDGVDPARWAKILGRSDAATPEIRTLEPSTDVTAATTAQAKPHTRSRATLRGRIQRFEDHIDTDAIIPGEFCHLTRVEDLGAHAFAFVRPEFVARVRLGQDVIVAGEAWGSGSSREQAVWALQGAGVRAVIAKSFAFIHKRNLVNEALPFLVVRDPTFYQLAQEGTGIAIDFDRAEVEVAGCRFAAHGATPMIQALSREGGLVLAIQRHGTTVFTQLAEPT